MIASIQIKNTDIVTFVSVLVLKLSSRKVLFTNRLHLTKIANLTGQLLQNYVIGMRTFRILLKHLSDHLSVLFQFA